MKCLVRKYLQFNTCHELPERLTQPAPVDMWCVIVVCLLQSRPPILPNPPPEAVSTVPTTVLGQITRSVQGHRPLQKI